MAETLETKPIDDLSALAWVQSELKRSLENANKALRRYLRESEAVGRSDLDTADPAVLRAARAQLHQGVGALELVGLPGPARVLRAAEAAVQRMLNRPGLVDEGSVQAIERVSFALLDYLARLLAGKPVSPVALFPQYRDAQQLAGAERVHPADLWDIDFRWHELPPDRKATPLPDDEARDAMENTVLGIMRHPDARTWDRLAKLCSSLGVMASGRAATLWRLAAAFAQAESAGLLPPGDVYVKRVAARLLAQLRNQLRQSDEEPSERLAQDLLFFCANARTPTEVHHVPRLVEVRRLWRLDSVAPVDYEATRLGRFDPAWIAQARKRVAGAKDVWSAVAGGEQHRLAGLSEQFSLLCDSVERLFPSGAALAKALQDIAAAAVASGGTPPVPLAMEVATSVLYLDATLEDGDLDNPDLGTRIGRLAQRIESVRGGAAPAALEPWMEELYRRVSDRQTMGSVVHELRASLSEVEKQIDQYFRDPSQRELLIPVPNQLSAMRGVLSVLGMDQASQAVLHMRDDVDALAQTEVDPQQAVRAGTFDRLADNLGALSFLIDMLSVQPQLAKSLFRFDPEEGSLRAVMQQSERISAFGGFDELTPEEPDESAPSTIAPELMIAEPPVPAPSHARAASEPATGLEDDAEMRDVFLDEAREVIAAARLSLAELRESPDDVAELTTVRRAFHTLKGSSRMVGLRDFGDAAWACEQLYNARLAQAPRMDEDLSRFTAEALDYLGDWTDAIADGASLGHASPAIVDAADGLRVDGVLRPIGAPRPLAAAAVHEPPAVAEPLAVAAEALPLIEAIELPPLGAEPAADTEPQPLELSDEDLPGFEPLPALESDATASLIERVPDLPQPFELDLAPPAAAEPAPEAPEVSFELDLGAEAAPYEGAQALPEPAVVPAAPEAIGEPEAVPQPEAVELSQAEALAELEPEGGAVDEAEAAEAEAEWLAAPAADPAVEALPAGEVIVEPVDGFDAFAEAAAAAAPVEAAAVPIGDVAEQVPPEFQTVPLAEPIAAAEAVEEFAPAFDPESTAVVDVGFGADESATAAQASSEAQLPTLSDEVALPAQAAPPQMLDLVAPAPEAGIAELPELPELTEIVLPAAGPGDAFEAPEAVEGVEAALPEPPLPEPEVAEAGALGGGDEAAAAAADDEQTKIVGPLRIPIPLFNIYLNEADELSRRLATEVGEWSLEYDRRPVPESTIALAHSLAGSSATVGYTDLSALARALEHALLRSSALGHGSRGEPELFAEAAEEIRRLLHQFAAGFIKPMAPQLLERLAAHELSLSAAVVPDTIEEEPLAAAEAAEAREPEPFETLPLPVVHSEAPVFGALEAPAATDAVVGARADAFDDEEDIDAVDATDAELFPIFEEEAEELLPQLQARLRDWVLRPSDRSAAAACMRTLHTFKGGARLAGAMRLGEMAHRLETAIEHAAALDEVSAERIEPLMMRGDAMAAAFEALRRPGAAPPVAPIVPAQPAPVEVALPPPAPVQQAPAEPAASLPESIAAESPAAADAEPFEHEPAVAAAPPAIDWTRFHDAQTVVAAAAERASGGSAAVRVRSGLLDRLVNQAGEVSITRARIDADVRQLQSTLNDLTDNLDRLRHHLRDIELQAESQITSRIEAAKAAAQAFDPLEMDRFTRFQELTRMMAESVNDVATVQRSVQRTLQSTEDELAAQARLTRELQDDLLRTRMVEFESLVDRLYRVVRQSAKDTGKQVRLDIIGGAIEVDRGVLERMVGPLEHLLRNSVVHGIEPPASRLDAGKEATGTIVVTVTQEGNEIGVECRDDGGGLDLQRIRQHAEQRGLIAAGQDVGDAELANLIFASGFTTVAAVTELAGRGVGLDVVRAEVNAMGGRIETHSTAGQGTSFRLVLPLTTAVTQVVMVRCGEMRIAIPSTLIEIVRRVPTEQVEPAYASGAFTHADHVLPFFWLGALLQHSARGPAVGRAQVVVIVRSAAQRVALHVDEVVGNQEVVVKHVGAQLSRLPGLAGVTLLPSGAVALIYNPVALATLYGDAARQRSIAALVGAAAAAAEEEEPRAPLVLVVDDSLTVRRVTQRLLVREGYRVALAKDGLDALEKLAQERPAVMLSDIEMPRMDGFDLLRNVRADERVARLPVIMITSRIAQKHRDYAGELGADHYLGKPFSEEELLTLVARYAAAPVLV